MSHYDFYFYSTPVYTSPWREIPIKQDKIGKIVTDEHGARHRIVKRFEKDLPWDCIRIIKIIIGILFAIPFALLPSYRKFFFASVEVKKCAKLLPVETIVPYETFYYIDFCEEYGKEALKDCTPDQKERVVKAFLSLIGTQDVRTKYAEDVAVLRLDLDFIDQYQKKLLEFMQKYDLKEQDVWIIANEIEFSVCIMYLDKELIRLNNLNIENALKPAEDSSDLNTQIETFQKARTALEAVVKTSRKYFALKGNSETIRNDYKALIWEFTNQAL